jgi:hypothetical protein
MSDPVRSPGVEPPAALGQPVVVPTEQSGVLLRLRSLRKAAIITSVVGVAHAVLFLISLWMLSDGPGPSAPDDQIVAYYSSDSHRRWMLAAGLYLMPFAGIAFIWFIVAMRAWARGYIRRENALLSNVQLVAGVIYTALFFIAAAAESVTAASAEFSDVIEPDVARLFPEFGRALLLVFAMRMAAMFVLTTTNIMRATRLLPHWFSLAGYVVAIFLLLSASFNPLLVTVFPIWMLAFCGITLYRARRIPTDGSLVAIEAEGIVLVPAAESE